jgi:hypothetical protein
MKYPLFSDVALTRNLPAHGLRRGDVVRLVDHHLGDNGKEGYSIEVFNALGDTVLVTTVDETALEPLHDNEVLSVRRINSAAA